MEKKENKTEENKGEEITESTEAVKEVSFSERRLKEREEEMHNKIASWKPKTEIGRAVKSGKIKNIDEVLSGGKKILEPEIVDSLMHLESDLLSIGQAKGKFGGGKRRAWRQTQRKTQEGNVLSFSAMAVVGDKKDHIGLGSGKAAETLPAREKSLRDAKLNIFKINKDCAHFDCACDQKHTVPYTVEGKCGSVRIKLMPAPQGTGLVAGNEVKKILTLAGITDVYSVTDGSVRTTFNLAKACIMALKKTTKMEK